jgi:hypothetical protein
MRSPRRRLIGMERGARQKRSAIATDACRSLLIIVFLAWSGDAAHAFAYKTARGLYQDCVVGLAGHDTAATPKYRRCAGYIEQIFNNWNLNQDNGICSRHVGAALPKAYVAYWRARGLGLLRGTFTSAQTSVNEFLDSQKQPCPTQDPKTHPP